MRHVVLASILMLVGCGGSLPAATSIDASRAHVELADLRNGRSLVVAKCGACHRPPMPASHGASEWPEKLDEMSARAHLDFMQRQLIQQYLVAMAGH